MSTIEIKLLGSFLVVRDGQPVAALHGKRCRDLLSYLSLHRDENHARSYLAELLWGDLDTERARHCFNTALWRLQRALGSEDPSGQRWLRHDAHSIGFNPIAGISLDVADFEQRCAWAEQLAASDADQAAIFWHQALVLYRGDLLADCYEDWCLADRTRLQRLYIRAARRLMRHHAVRREFDAAIDAARRILVCDPLHEQIHRELINLYIASDQPTAALEQYRTCEQLLRRELGTAPLPETQALLRRIIHLRGQERAATAPQTLDAPSEPILLPNRSANPAAADEHRATVLVQQACRHLKEAVRLLEAVADRFGPPLSAPDGTAATALYQAALHLAEAAQELEPEPAAG